MRNKETEAPPMKEFKRVFNYVEETKTVDEAGNIIRSESVKGYTKSPEPDFVKLYLDTMKSFNGLEQIPTDLLIVLSGCMEGYADGPKKLIYFRYDKFTKRKMTSELGIKESMLNKYVSRLKDSGTLVKTDLRGVYLVNPWLLSRGQWKYISDMRAYFDFRNGEWKVNLVTEKPSEEEISTTTTNTEPQLKGQIQTDNLGNMSEVG